MKPIFRGYPMPLSHNEETDALAKRDALLDAAEAIEQSCPGMRVIVIFEEAGKVVVMNQSKHDHAEMKKILQTALDRFDNPYR